MQSLPGLCYFQLPLASRTIVLWVGTFCWSWIPTFPPESSNMFCLPLSHLTASSSVRKYAKGTSGPETLGSPHWISITSQIFISLSLFCHLVHPPGPLSRFFILVVLCSAFSLCLAGGLVDSIYPVINLLQEFLVYIFYVLSWIFRFQFLLNFGVSCFKELCHQRASLCYNSFTETAAYSHIMIFAYT